MEPTSRLEATAPVRATTTPLETPETADPGSLRDEVQDAGTVDTDIGAINDPLPGIGLDPFSWILELFGGNGVASGVDGSSVTSFFSSLWTVYVIFAFIISFILLALYTYASVWRWYYYGQADRELREAEQLWKTKHQGPGTHSRLDDINTNIASENPNDWKLAIIEADIILDGILKDRGYPGATLGERLKSVSPNQLGSLQDAWEAHKTRNMIAHEGPDFVLTRRLAEDTIKRYKRVFEEFGVL